MSQFECAEKSSIGRKRKGLTRGHKKKAKKTKVDVQDKTLPIKEEKTVNSNATVNSNKNKKITSEASKTVIGHKNDSLVTNGKISRWKKRRLHFKQQKKTNKYGITKRKVDSSEGKFSEKDVSQMICNENKTIIPDQRVVNAKPDISKQHVRGLVDDLKQKDEGMYSAKSERKHCDGTSAVKWEDVSKNLSSNWKNLQPLLQKTKEENMLRRKAVSTHINKDLKHKHSKTSIKIKDHKPRNTLKSSTATTESTEKKVHTENQKEKSGSDIWFDDVDEILIEGIREKPLVTEEKVNPLVKLGTYNGVTKAVAMDCEMVGVGDEGRESVLARVSIVNQYGNCIYDKFVKPQEEVVDYRTFVSGVTPQHLINAEEFSDVQKDVSEILKGRILVGHALFNDLKVLFLDHSWKKIRDTSTYKPFRQLFGGKTPSLKKLTAKLLGVKVQEGEHNSVQDAQAAMRLYTMYRIRWEKDIKTGVIKLKKDKKRKIER